MKKSLLLFFCLCLIISVLCCPLKTVARDVTFVPSLNIRGEYDDNVTFTRKNKKDDFLSRTSPALELDYATELLNLRSRESVDFLRYANETSLNTENLHCQLDGDYRLTERYSFSGNFSYVKDTTLESELQETGIVSVREKRERYNGGMGLSYQLSEISDMGVNYTHTKTDYDWEGNIDYDSDSVTVSYNRQLSNQIDAFTFQPYYSQTDSDASKVNNYGVSFGWSHLFSETLRLTSFLGARYTEIEYTLTERQLIPEPPFFRVIFREVREKDRNWGGVADIKLRKTGERFSTTIGYSRNLSYSSLGEPIERDKIYLNTNKRLTRRLRALFYGSFYFTKSEGKSVNEDSRYANIRPSLDYRITENHSLDLAYNYSCDYDKTLSHDRDVDRHRVWVALRLRFPGKW